MAATIISVFLVLSLILCGSSTIALEKFYMDKRCGSFIDMSYATDKNSFKLKLTDDDEYRNNMNCHLLIKAPLFDQLMVKFLDVDIDCSDSLQLYNGPLTTSPKLGSKVCGSVNPSLKTTTGGELLLVFKSDSSKRDDGFKLLITSFHTGICSSSEFECNNGRCIDYSLYCNDYDNCGDNSDYCFKDYNWWIWMVVGIIIFLILCVVVTVVCCCMCKRSHRGSVIKTNDQPLTQYQSGAQTVPGGQANPWFGGPNPGTYQSPGVTYPHPPGPAPVPVMPSPPAYSAASGSVYPPTQPPAPGWQEPAMPPPPYSEKAPDK